MVGVMVVGVEVHAHHELEPGQKLLGAVPLAEVLGLHHPPHVACLEVARCPHPLSNERPERGEVPPVHDDGEGDKHLQFRGQPEQGGGAADADVPGDLAVPDRLGPPVGSGGHQEHLLDAKAGEDHVRVHLRDVVRVAVEVGPVEAPHRSHHAFLKRDLALPEAHDGREVAPPLGQLFEGATDPAGHCTSGSLALARAHGPVALALGVQHENDVLPVLRPVEIHGQEQLPQHLRIAVEAPDEQGDRDVGQRARGVWLRPGLPLQRWTVGRARHARRIHK
mmetsp:Transcript_34927/g.104525  ORF Transcript_34927/g.104525 Transcript_34927/m.104525 type:complete len:279 (+) Transcript_34927:529-1365(+)